MNPSPIVVDSPDDPRLARFRLRERELRPRHVPARVRRGRTADSDERVDPGLFVAEGDLVVERALRAGCIPRAALTDSESPARVVAEFGPDVELFAATDEARRMLTGLGVALDVIALFERPPTAELADVLGGSIVVVEDVDNPTNVGAIARSAAAFGAHGLVLDRNSSDPLARRALRVSMGTTLSMKFCRVDDLSRLVDELHARGFETCALTPRPDAEDISNVGRSLAPGRPVAIFLGSERTGLRDSTLASVGHRVRIPMAAGIDSLNVAAAAAVACHALLPRIG